jgi:soluble lytic murein transglycosylase-like protein
MRAAGLDPRTRRRGALAVAALAAVALAIALLSGGDDKPKLGPLSLKPGATDPFGYSPDREQEFSARAAAGFSHVIYAKSPGGVVATARRTARWRPLVDRTAARHHIDPDLLESLVFLESAGRPDAVAGRDVRSAAGLTQILAETAQNLLGMRVDVAASQKLTRQIRRAAVRGRERRLRRLEARRAKVDERFDPAKALEATGRYIDKARERFSRDDLAFVSYHMGIGNLGDVIDAYGEDEPSYARLYFDSAPDDHERAYALLSRLGDDSSTYWWRLAASRQVMRLYRHDGPELDRLAALQTAKGSAEEVLHPRASTIVFADPDALDGAYADGSIRPFPDDPARLGLRRDPRMGQLASKLRRKPSLYRGLRPEAYALAAYMAGRVRDIARTRTPLVVTSTVRDERYQRQLLARNIQATPAYSLHITGFAFDVLRGYRSRAQAKAFQFMLDRLQALNLIAWVREPEAIHVTASGEGRRLESLLKPD